MKSKRVALDFYRKTGGYAVGFADLVMSYPEYPRAWVIEQTMKAVRLGVLKHIGDGRLQPVKMAQL